MIIQKTPEIGFTYHIGTETGLILPLKQFTPIDVGKEVVRLDLCGTVGTETTLRIAVEQAREKIPSSWWDDITAGESQGLLQDLAVHLVRVLVVEGGQTRQHLIEQDTQSPPIHCLRVPIAEQ
jgi:hypothetical protein